MTSSNPHHALIRRAQTQVNRLRSRLQDASTTASSETRSQSRSTPPSPDGYRIIREIHRGGQGIVYLAEQESTCRTVALKVMREGPLASEAERVRFKQEVRLLAALRHPHIVTIHDSGESGGRFYYIMDYIEGLPLDAYIRVNRPAVNDTLRLFVQIAGAVNAAHLRGVIHRDLKPPNVLVDRAGRPHVLDFGLAKVLSGAADSVEEGALTRTGEFVGSLPWASPEQAEGKPDEIDARSDVYSLGVLLYQALTGRFPYPVAGSARTVLDNIVNATPQRPRTIGARIGDEVETIVLKCLAKDRARRYQNAGEIARDLEHYLNGEPIEAKRDSFGYVLRKQLRKHRLLTGFAVALVLFSGGLALSALSAWTSYQRAERARANEAVQRTLAGENARRAANEAAKSQAINEFLLNDLLAVADPTVAMNRELTVRQALDAASERIAGRYGQQPRVLAAIRATLGRTYLRLAEYDSAEAHLAEALRLCGAELGPEHVDTLSCAHSLALLYDGQGRYDEAEQLFSETLETSRRALGDEHLTTLRCAAGLAALLQNRGEPTRAESLYQEALVAQRHALGNAHPLTLTTMCELARLYNSLNRPEEAASLSREALEELRRQRGDDHPNTLFAMNIVAGSLLRSGRLDEAGSLFSRVYADRRRVLGADHHATMATANSLAAVLLQQGRADEAESLFREVLAQTRAALGDDHPDVLVASANLAGVMHARGELGKCEALLTETLHRARARLGDEHPFTLSMMGNLALVLQDRGKAADAVELLRGVLAARRRELGDEQPITLAATYDLGMLLAESGEPAEGESLLRSVVDTAARTMPAHDSTLMSFRRAWGQCLLRLKRFDEAEGQLLACYDNFPAEEDAWDGESRKVLDELVRLYEAWKKPDRAAEFRKLLERAAPNRPTGC